MSQTIDTTATDLRQRIEAEAVSALAVAHRQVGCDWAPADLFAQHAGDPDRWAHRLPRGLGVFCECRLAGLRSAWAELEAGREDDAEAELAACMEAAA